MKLCCQNEKNLEILSGEKSSKGHWKRWANNDTDLSVKCLRAVEQEPTSKSSQINRMVQSTMMKSKWKRTKNQIITAFLKHPQSTSEILSS